MPAAWRSEADRICEALANPVPFLVFNVTDACPDNHFIRGETVRFFDFEFAGYGHALLESSYARLPFPTCWCMGRLPEAETDMALDVYRSELGIGIPQAFDDAVFERTLMTACTYWTFATITWSLKEAMVVDQEWGLASQRQRHVYRLERLRDDVERLGYYPAMGEVATTLATSLRSTWLGDDLEMPVYPAFCDTPPDTAKER
jgi:hypothetical protein